MKECEGAERALLASDCLFRKIFEEGPIGVALISLDFRILRANLRFCEMLGYTEEEIVSLGIDGITHPEDIEKDRHLADRLYAGEIPFYTIEKRYVCKDAKTIWGQLTASLVHNAQGEAILGIGRIKDITEQKRAEEEIRRGTAVVEGINRIFEKALTCRTEEELGEMCINAALETTSSRFGFIGLLNRRTTGLDDFAVGDPGWEACRVQFQSGDGKSAPVDLALDGSYGRVLRDGKAFYTNDPDRIGFSEGHPPLESFLGVPLVLGGKPIGMLGVANRAGGYREKDLEDLEKMAPAIVQALIRKQAEEALRESEERYRSFVRNFQGIAFRGKIDFTPIFFHGAVEEITGYTEAEFVSGKPRWDQVMHPEDLIDPVFSEKAKNIQSVPDYSCERNYRIVRKDGNIRWIHEIIRNLCGDSGQPATVQGAIYDITERKRMEDHLRKYQNIVSSTPDAIAFLDEDYRYVIVNDAYERFSGTDRERFVGLTVAEYLGEDVFRQVVKPNFDRCLQGETVTYQEWFDYPTVGRRFVNVTYFPYRDDCGRIDGVVANSRDITEEKLAGDALRISEERLKEAQRIAKIGDWFWEVDSGCAGWSDQVYEIFKAPRSQPSYELAESFVHSEDLERWRGTIRKAVEEQKPFSLDYRAVRSDGEIVWVQNETRPLLDERGRFSGFRGTVQDVTERKLAQEALKKLNDSLEQQVADRTAIAEARSKQLQSLAVELIEAEERERQRTAHFLHDDLQQLLAAVRFQLQICMRKSSGDSELSVAKEMLDESIEKSRRLSHELSPPVLHHCGISESVRWLANRMGEQFGLSVEFETNLVEKFETPLKAFLFRALRELLFNAVKHAETNSAKVELFASDGDLLLSVSDGGRGFDTDTLNRADKTAGFGLFTIKERANHVGGSLAIESAPGRGSRFTLKVPLSVGKKAPRRESSAKREKRVRQEIESPVETCLRVLFADDHKVMRKGLVRLISSNPGIEAAGEAENGREAVEMARQLKPDVILMDVSMPEMDGIEATRRIKAEMPEIRVIGLSLFDDEKMSETMRNAGAESFLSKTASPAELLKAIYANG